MRTTINTRTNHDVFGIRQDRQIVAGNGRTLAPRHALLPLVRRAYRPFAKRDASIKRCLKRAACPSAAAEAIRHAGRRSPRPMALGRCWRPVRHASPVSVSTTC
jgi:hypothetical protein